jgi:hypothetical protein
MKVFKLLSEGLMAGTWERYHGVATTYFAGTQQDHYVFKLGCMIAQADRKAKVRRLETLTKILTFRQGNRFAFSSLVSMMLIVEKELMNWATWFS